MSRFDSLIRIFSEDPFQKNQQNEKRILQQEIEADEKKRDLLRVIHKTLQEVMRDPNFKDGLVDAHRASEFNDLGQKEFSYDGHQYRLVIQEYHLKPPQKGVSLKFLIQALDQPVGENTSPYAKGMGGDTICFCGYKFTDTLNQQIVVESAIHRNQRFEGRGFGKALALHHHFVVRSVLPLLHEMYDFDKCVGVIEDQAKGSDGVTQKKGWSAGFAKKLGFHLADPIDQKYVYQYEGPPKLNFNLFSLLRKRRKEF